jgi:hypothetical protein
MKNQRSTISVLILVIVLSVVSSAQVKREMSRGIIEIAGTTLHLGMTKAEVAEKLAGAEITKDKEDFWTIGIASSLQFTNGRLSYARRNWPNYSNDIFEAFYGAVNHINDEGYSACRVTADSKLAPGETWQRVWIVCGDKTILIVRYSAGGKSFNMVDEMLGAIR